MSAAVCSICEEKSRIKLASIYWRWVWPSGDFRGYRQLYDPVCIGSVVNKYKLAEAHPDLCVKCEGQISYPASVKILGYAFFPGQDRTELALPYCATCFEEDVDLYTRNA